MESLRGIGLGILYFLCSGCFRRLGFHDHPPWRRVYQFY